MYCIFLKLLMLFTFYSFPEFFHMCLEKWDCHTDIQDFDKEKPP